MATVAPIKKQTKKQSTRRCDCHPWLSIACFSVILVAIGLIQSATAQDRSRIPIGRQLLLDSQESIVANGDLTEGIVPAAVAQESEPTAAPTAPHDPLLFESGPTRVKLSLDAVVQKSGATGSWWNLSEQFAPDAGYKLDRAWAEGWIKPGIRVDTTASHWFSPYSGVSYVGSGNIGEDVFEQGNQGLWSLEDAYLGARIELPVEESSLDLSYGRQPYKIGSGMLISVGAMNGFERGATTTFARRAWEEAGIAKWTRGRLSIDGFYLNLHFRRSCGECNNVFEECSEIRIV